MRAWGKTTLGSAAVPVFGDALTAAFTGVLTGGFYKVTVASTTKYQVGDRIIVNPGTTQSVLLINGIASSTVLNCQSEGGAAVNSAVSTSLIMLDIACMDISIQPASGGAAAMILGTDSTVTNTGGGTAFYELDKTTAGTQPNVYRLANHIGQDAIRTSEFWIVGTSGDAYYASAEVN